MPTKQTIETNCWLANNYAVMYFLFVDVLVCNDAIPYKSASYYKGEGGLHELESLHF